MAEEKPFRVRDKRNKGWFWVDNEYLNVYGKFFGAIGTAIYLNLCRHADEEQKCFPSIKMIAEELGISERTVKKYLKLFRDYRLIKVERERSKDGKWLNNVYWLLDKSEWIKPGEIISPGLARGKSEQSQGQLLPPKNTNRKNTHNISSYEGVLKNTTNEVSIIRNYFIQKCQELKGFKPEMSFAKEGRLIKEKLKRYSVDQLKDLIDKFLNSEVGERLGWTLSVCLSAPVINQWLAGKLEKKKRPYWNGFPLRRVFGKWQVLVDGEWKEFAGNEKEIVFK
jgi:hypothetical protein